MMARTTRPHGRTARKATPLPGREPPLEEMLADPVVQAIMSVDGVRPAEIVTLLRAAKERLDASGRMP